MEADWSAEIGGDAAVIDQGWPGWIDIAQDTSRIALLDEVEAYPPLGDALKSLLQSGSGFSPTKCDFWTSDESVDPFEFDAETGSNCASANCYLDLMPRQVTRWKDLSVAESWARTTVNRLRMISGRNARVEIVLRQAFDGEQSGIGASIYIRGCGSTISQAEQAMMPALAAAVKAVCEMQDENEATGRLQ